MKFVEILSDWPLFLLSLTILFLEAFFSGSEMALISADRLFLKRQAVAGHKGARAALALLAHPEQMLATVLLGTSSCILLQGTITTIYVHRRFGDAYDLYSVMVLTPLVLIFGELIPKTLFQRYANQIAGRVAIPVGLVRTILTPIIWLLNHYTGWISKRIEPLEDVLTGKHKDTHRDALTYLLTHGRKETSIKKFESKMIHKILNFSRAAAKNASIPLVNVDAISDDDNVESALKIFALHRHSRLPVYRDRIDNIVGIVHVFDLFSEKNDKRLITDLMIQPFYVPETQKLDDLLFTMQQQGMQMAIVVDEYGGAVGIVTLEDLIEEIVGDISDEYDSEIALYKQLDENTYLVQASMEIDAINDQLKLGLPTGQYETLAGFLLLQFNRIPDEGDELFFSHFKFVIRQGSSRAIKLVEITKT